MSHFATQLSPQANKVDTKASSVAQGMSVEVFLFHLYKTFSAMRMYDSDHRLLQDVLQQLFTSLDEIFEDRDEVKISLTESEMIFQGHPVYREEEKRGSLIFLLYNDGVREIRFERGLSHEEIVQFLEALKTNSRLPQEERDIVSLFWSKSFDHIHYYAVDEIPDQEIECVDRTLAELDSRGYDAGPAEEIKYSQETRSLLKELEEDIFSREPSAEPPIISQLKAYTQEEIEELLETVREGRRFLPEGELIGIIFDILRIEDDEDRYLPVLHLLEEFTDELLAKVAFAPVNQIITGLKAFVEDCRKCSRPLGQPAESLLTTYSTEEKVNLILSGLKGHFSFEPQDLRTFVTLLGPTAVLPLCSLLEQIEDSTLRHTLCQGLEILSRGQTSRFARPLKTASVKVAKDIITVLGKIGDRSALEIVQTCSNHQHGAVREEAIRALRTVGTPQAQKALMLFLEDEDPRLRVAAAEGLDSFEEYNDVKPVLDIVRRKTFRKYSYREKKALLSVLGKRGSPECLRRLEALLRKRALINRKRQDETRACAALALANVQSDAIKTLLEQFSNDSSTKVRKACNQALGPGNLQHSGENV